jgi:hypothetical protein
VHKQPNPFVTVDASGLWVHVPQRDGGTKAVNVSADSGHVLLAEIVEKAEMLKDPDVQKKIASKGVGLLIDWAQRKWSKR